MQSGSTIEPNKIKVGDFLDQWLTDIRARVAPKTHERYASLIRANIKPALGGIVLVKLEPGVISQAYSEALKHLAPRTVHHMHRVLAQALKQAVRWRKLPRNPCDDVDPPKVERREMKVWDVATTATALELVRPWRVHVPVLLAALCGLRRGEIAALRWRNIDLLATRVRSSLSWHPPSRPRRACAIRQPKNGKGRTVALPLIMVAELRAWRLQAG